MSARTIQRLDETVVNRIAAGEVIHRPANALKEIIENSLDAGATTISVQAKQGGNKLLQVADNGHGIKKADLDIVCERFTTSKLKQFEDLQNIATFGFRGEALASISHVAHLTITSRTSDSPCAFKAKYVDGKLAPFTPGGNCKPKPCAGVQGTQITIEDLFYNILTRKRALKNPSEEYNKIVHVVTRYALHYPAVAFTCKKYGESASDVHTPGGTLLETFKVLFGNALAREILEFEHTNDALDFRITSLLTNPNYHCKKITFILFINNRLVESPAIKRALQETYSTFLPKGTNPFIYLALHVKPQNVDVNVHPTKSEVHVLHEEKIIQAIQKLVEEKLLSCDTSRSFQVQQTLVPPPASPAVTFSTPPPSQSVAPSRRDRSDTRDRPLSAFFSAQVKEEDDSRPYARAIPLTGVDSPPPAPREPIQRIADSMSSSPRESTSGLAKRGRELFEEEAPTPMPLDEPEDDFQLNEPMRKQTRRVQTPAQPVLLTSVRNLVSQVESQGHKGLSDVFHNFSFVGCVDANSFLIQHRTKLYLVQAAKLSQQLFFQNALRKFSNFPVLRLSSPAPLRELIILALEQEDSGWTPEDGSKEEIAAFNVSMLQSFAPMLEEYFSISISSEGGLLTLPQLIPQYVPPLEDLPQFILNLCSQVDWSEEQVCFQGIAEQLALFYHMNPISALEMEEDPSLLDRKNRHSRAWALEHLLCPALRTDLTPTKELGNDGSVMMIACVEKLYKVFERC